MNAANPTKPRNNRTAPEDAVLASLPLQADTDVRLFVNSTARQITCAIDMPCRAETVYQVWSEVTDWRCWDPDTRWSRLDGPFVAGTRGRIAPQKGLPVSMTLTETIQNEAFTVVCPVLGSTMIFEHRITGSDDRISVSHRVQFCGWLSLPLMRVVGKDVIRGLPLTMTRLRAYCQAAER